VPLLSEAAHEYYLHLQARNHSEQTARGRRNTVRKLATIAGDRQCAKVEPRHIDQLFSKHPHWTAGTRNNALYNLQAFFRWCRFRRYVPRDYDPLHGWKKERYEVPPKLRIAVTEWPRLFQHCDNPVETIAVATGLYLFLRASEQQCLQVQHVHLADHEIEVFRPKVRRWDTMPISAELAPYLREHLTWMAARGFANREHFLMPARFPAKVHAGVQGFLKGAAPYNPDRPIGRPYVIIQGVLERAGYPTFREGEHTLRRSGARAYFDSLVGQGYDGALRRVMSMLGHRNSKVTEVYLGLDIDRLTRNRDLRGKPMFPELTNSNVTSLTRSSRGH
jgi:integrase